MNYVEIATRPSTMFAIYAYAAIADGPDSRRLLLANLYDQLHRSIAGRTTPWQGRGGRDEWLAAARRGEHGSLLRRRRRAQKGVQEEDADLIAHSPSRLFLAREDEPAPPSDLLGEFLDHPSLIVREAALGNLIAFFDPEAGKKPELGGLNVAARGGARRYHRVLKAWKAWAEDVKKKMVEKK